MSALKKLVIFLLVLVIGIPTVAFGYLYFKLNTMYDKESGNSEVLSGQDFKTEKGINNILLVGIDARNLDEQARSDSMMILTVDNKNKSLKLTSLARDTYVDIPGHGMDKLTHAYAYGGVDLLLQTIEHNFELDIQNYAIVNFYSFMDIMDVVGSIEIDVKEGEIKEMNKYITESYKFYKNPNKGPIEYIQTPGVQELNPYQALTYARIRKNDSAYARDERQRMLIQALANKVKDLPAAKYSELIDAVLPNVKTNMKATKIMSVGATALSIGNFDIKQLEFPILEYSQGGKVGSAGWVLQYDSDKCIPILHDFIFNDISYEGANK